MTDADQLVGQTIAGKYRIFRLIGVGGMGSVYEGQHIELERKVAVKILDAVTDTSADLAKRFRREARAASAVESDGIVQVFDVGHDPNVGLYMVMELLNGEDLEVRLRKQPGRRLDPLVVVEIGHQVARALVKAHAARVIHRDLKPANLFLTHRDDGSLQVKILDFGISKLLNDASFATNRERAPALTAAGMALGTPQYMSPEQAQGLTTVDHRADVWGLGVVLYEALAGFPAFPELATYQETILNLFQGPPQPLSKVAPWVPDALARVVHEALVHDVDARIQECATFAARLAEALPERMSVSLAVRRASLRSIEEARTLPLPGPPQVVVRATDTAPLHDVARTLVVDGTRIPGDAAPRLNRYDPSKSAGPSRTPAATPSAVPTTLQSPAWMDPSGGPGTLKTGVSFADPPPEPLARRWTQVINAAVTALVIVSVGVCVLLVARRSETIGDSAGAAPLPTVESPSIPALSPEPPAPSPPPSVAPSATEVGAVPVPAVTGSALSENAPSPPTTADASGTAAAAR